jgi:methylphosphotriester-DNA--protein-cysteine methyltransferase
MPPGRSLPRTPGCGTSSNPSCGAASRTSPATPQWARRFAPRWSNSCPPALDQRSASPTRTLQRRLGEEGVTFQELLADVREGLARHYLTQSTLSLTEIAFLLGYDDPNSFHRAFNRWTGHTPLGVRDTATG